MSIRDLYNQLGEIIADNEKKGESARNNIDLFVKVARSGRKKDWYLPIRGVSSDLAWGVLNKSRRIWMEIVTTDSDRLEATH